ncbi:succinyl-diaminopimelate desuccinylase [Candidatus Pelagibacter bacterium]|nr:succinyl-diaminopimelate desuccinylase [bacterium]MDB2359098.1 succinyl-diaminopimelate desuccinylase [Candidatus Pelagibacter bacterium]MDB3960543.1 succinyl-diaminopimelate desuccinylase [Candidatus Pelagibacter sp.]MDB9765578.1 succinyl-diaminopimelate desuccinylase [Candidatus Pelagibacter sp.]
MASINELQLAKELIKFPTVTPIDAGIMKFLEKKLKTLGFKTKILEFKEKNSKPVKNLYARLGNKGPNFCYAGHLDVVPAGNLKDWTVNPFKPSIKKGYLIGRGANDMKSSIAAFVSAVSSFVENKRKFNGSISLLITGDEEGVAINGTKKVVDYLRKKKEKIDFCLVGEPTNPNKLGEMIKIGRRGSMTGRLSIVGIQGHVAYPQRANNPSTALVQILKELKEIKFDNGTKDFQPTNLEVTKINIDNSADNVIPGLANATFNIRFNNKHSSSSLKKKIDKIIKKISSKNKSKYKIDYSVSGEAFLTKPNNTTFMIRDIIKKITKIKPKLSTTGGTSDARFIRKIAPCLEFGLVGKTMHKVDEAVSLSDLKNLTLIYSNILQNYFK